MKVRAKFHCGEVTTRRFKHGQEHHILLAPVAADMDPKSWEATPNGSVLMTVTNPLAAEYFEPGAFYHVYFEKASGPLPPR